MRRLAGVAIGMAAAALVVAYLAFGWPILVVGGPLLAGVVCTLGVLVLTERPRELLLERRAGGSGDSPWKTAAERGGLPGTSGLMSGFFEVSPQYGVLPEQRPAPSSGARPADVRR